MLKDRARKGFILIAVYMVVVVLAILGAAFLAKSVTEARIAQREKMVIQALHLAEAGIDYALVQLREGVSSGNNSDSLPDIGNYNCSWNQIAGQANRSEVFSTGIAGDASRTVRVEVEKQDMPDNFFDNALYVSGDVTFNGDAYEVNGGVIYSGSLSGNPDNITPNPPLQDSSISPLIRLDFSQLRQISEAQGNIYDALRLRTDPLPDSFFYEGGTPNVVYVESDLTLNGNIGTVAGFFVVVGDVITNPDNTEDTTINGNGEIQGAIYTTGEFRINGGGGGLNVSGGVWAGQEARLNGNTTVSYNAMYMQHIKNLDIGTSFGVISWQELP